MMMAIYPGFSIGNPPASILNTGSLQRQCVLDKGSWWFQVASWIGGDQYVDELASDVALNLLTVDSYVAF